MILKRIAYTVGVAASILPSAIAGPHRVLQDAYEIEKMEISLTDVNTEITDIKAVHNGEYMYNGLDLQINTIYILHEHVTQIKVFSSSRRPVRSIC